MNVEHIPAEDVDVLPCGADWQSRHLESERRKAEIRDRIHHYQICRNSLKMYNDRAVRLLRKEC